jgi:hypothetical protein
MRSLRTVKTGTLRWVQSASLSENFELREGADALGSLTWGSSCGTLASAVCEDGRWTFKRVGFLNPCVTARASGSEANAAVFRPRLWGDGLLELSGGRVVEWRPAGLWRNEWFFCETDGGRLITFKLENTEGLKGLLKDEGRADFSPGAVTRPEFTLLVFLGWYLLVLYQRDSDAAVAITASIG